jgi:hypothetical protein
VVLTSTKTAQLPYADAFVPYVKYCITWVSKDRCKLSCYTGVKFLKNILVKGIVSKAAMKGMSENIAVFMPIVKSETTKQTSKQGDSSSKDKAADQVSLKRMGTIKRPTSKNLSEEIANEKATSSWYDHVEPVVDFIKDLAEAIPFAVKIGVLAFVMLWLFYSWLRAGPRRDIALTHPQQRQQQVTSRAVYLRDINEGLLNADLEPAYGHSER